MLHKQITENNLQYNIQWRLKWWYGTFAAMNSRGECSIADLDKNLNQGRTHLDDRRSDSRLNVSSELLVGWLCVCGCVCVPATSEEGVVLPSFLPSWGFVVVSRHAKF